MAFVAQRAVVFDETALPAVGVLALLAAQSVIKTGLLLVAATTVPFTC